MKKMSFFEFPDYNNLLPYWKNFFDKAEQAIEENFWGNLSILKRAYRHNDSFTKQLTEIGFCFEDDNEKRASFYECIKWVFCKLNAIVENKILTKNEIFLPGKAFTDGKSVKFVIFGENFENSSNYSEINLLTPKLFVEMLSSGLFPIGEPIREHTNQTLCEHDFAHLAGFIACPEYMKTLRTAFQNIQMGSKIEEALQSFDSVYSLRLYYMTEIFSIISDVKKLEEILQLRLSDFPFDSKIYSKIKEKLKSMDPIALNKYLYNVYRKFPQVIMALGGESLDCLNRVRKMETRQTVSFYSSMSNLDSKFHGSSIYSLWLNGLAALENIRSTHIDYQKTIEEIHAVFIGSLIGTSQLKITDWVNTDTAVNKKGNLYKYICESGLWNENHVLYVIYKESDFTKIVKKE